MISWMRSSTQMIDLGISSLHDQLPDALQIWVPPGNIWFDQSQHIEGRLVQFHKNTIVNLSKPKKL